MDEIKYTTFTLQSGAKCIVNEFLGKHLFRAMSFAKNDTGLLIQHLLHQLCFVDGKQLTLEELDEMSIYDVVILQEFISMQMDKRNF